LLGNTISAPATSDEFNTNTLGLQWQWQANPRSTWMIPFPNKGVLRLFSAQLPDSFRNYWDVPNLLLQKFPADTFTATTKCYFKPNPKLEEERTGLIVIGTSYASVSVSKGQLIYAVCKDADKGNPEQQKILGTLTGDSCWFRVAVSAGAVCRFSYSMNGTDFMPAGEPFTATAGRWVGAKMGIFCTRPTQINDSGFADYDWFRVE
jgi:beta-xylosidase